MELTRAQKKAALVKAFLEAATGESGAAKGAIFIRQHILKEAAFAENHGILTGETVQGAINRKDEAMRDFALAVLNHLQGSPTQYQGTSPETETSAGKIKEILDKEDGEKVYKAMKFAAHRYIRSMAAHPDFKRDRTPYLRVA
jgi:hypothetical protein